MYCLLKLRRADKQVEKQIAKEAIEKDIFHLQVKRFNSAAITGAKLLVKWKLHNIKECQLVEHKVYSTKSRPKNGQKPDKIQYQVVEPVLQMKKKSIKTN